ncbi:MAG TPA: MEDS domain-containing protein [Candidatus Saccharimonadales bacterium]|nr:MEDS domain-containing protein [Candidatus Saccharimonadales bacterium]
MSKVINVLVMERNPELQVLYEQFFNIVASRVSFTIVSDINNMKISENNSDTRGQDNRRSNKTSYDLDLIQQSIFDVIILDVHSGNFRGVEVTKQILKMMPKQKIIITTTHDPGLLKSKLEKEKIPSSSLTVLQKPFKFTELLSVLSPTRGKFDKLKLTDHVLLTYDTIDEEVTDIVEFVKRGLENNELILLLIRNDMDITGISMLLKSAGLKNIDVVVKDKSLMIIKNEEWYIPDGKVDKHRIINQWHELVEQSIKDGKKGLRAFCMMDCFFDNVFMKEVVDYECTLPCQFPFQFVPVCAYNQNDFASIPELERKRLIECHNHMILK